MTGESLTGGVTHSYDTCPETVSRDKQVSSLIHYARGRAPNFATTGDCRGVSTYLRGIQEHALPENLEYARSDLRPFLTVFE